MAGAVCRTWQCGSSMLNIQNINKGSNLLSSLLRVPISTFPTLKVRGGPEEAAAIPDSATSPEVTATPDSERLQQERKMSSAMRLYLSRKREHDMFIAREQAEFDIGKQHLANMMGMDHNTMSQEDIDASIEYLFPSGLDPVARPLMKPPSEIFPRQKEAEFDMQGRPYQPFFYTRTPDFQRRIYQLRHSMEAVTIFGDRLRTQNKHPDQQQVLDLSKLADSRWVNKDELSKLTLEDISDSEYKEFIHVLERLTVLPFSYRVRDEIFTYRVTEGTSISSVSFITPEYDEQGRAYVEFQGQRKTATATVRVTKPGTGEVRVVHSEYPHYVDDLGYFFALKERLQIMYPLQITKMVGLVDLDITVQGGGVSGQAGAVRYALSMCLRSFVEKSMVDDMKINGLLTQDIRVNERKKPGKVKARKAYTWKRR